MSKIVSVHSYRGGTGKSNTTANLAALLAADGSKVCVVDTDIASPGIHILFNMQEEEMSPTLNEYLWGKCSIGDTMHDVTQNVVENTGTEIKGKIFLIPSSIKPGDIARILRENYDVGLLNDGFQQVVDEHGFDYLLIDTHPGLNEETLLSIAISNVLIIIMRPDQQDYQGTIVTVDVARKLDVPELFIVVNKVPPQWIEDGGEKLRSEVTQRYESTVGAIFPHTDEMMTLASSGIFSLRYPENPMANSMRNLAQMIQNVE